MIHATFALVFIACAAIVVFLGAGQYAFNKKDLDGFPCPRWKLKKPSSCWMADSGVGAKAGFWMLTVLILPVTLTMVLSMLPLFGTAGQELMYHLHRWCALLFSWIAIVELYMLIRMEVRKDMDPQN